MNPRRRMLLPLAFILWVSAMCPKIAKPQTRIMVDSSVVTYLEQMAETLHVETARCIVGYVSPDTIHLTAIAETPWLIREVTDTTVLWQWYRCPRNTVALWHAHPLRSAIRAKAWDSTTCNFSLPDAKLLMLPWAPLLSVVSVQRGRTCIFFRLRDGKIGQVPTTR